MVTPASLSSLFVLAIFDRCGQTGRALRSDPECIEDGAVAQLGEHLLCKQGVSGSIPLSSTIRLVLNWRILSLEKNRFASSL
jgi:hypothetical protein